MEKISITEVRNKFKEVDEKTKFELKYDLTERTLTFKLEGKEPIILICPECNGEKWVIEGALRRCLKCDSRYV